MAYQILKRLHKIVLLILSTYLISPRLIDM